MRANISGEISLPLPTESGDTRTPDFPLDASIKKRNVIAQVWYEGRKVEDTGENAEGLGRMDVKS